MTIARQVIATVRRNWPTILKNWLCLQASQAQEGVRIEKREKKILLQNIKRSLVQLSALSYFTVTDLCIFAKLSGGNRKKSEECYRRNVMCVSRACPSVVQGTSVPLDLVRLVVQLTIFCFVPRNQIVMKRCSCQSTRVPVMNPILKT